MPEPVKNEGELNNSKFNFTSNSRNEQITNLIKQLFDVVPYADVSSHLETLFNLAISSKAFSELPEQDRSDFFFVYNRLSETFRKIEAIQPTEIPTYLLN